MDFLSGLPLISYNFNIFWVTIDQLTKFDYFLLIHSSYIFEKLAQIYLREMVHLYRVTMSTSYDRGSY